MRPSATDAARSVVCAVDSNPSLRPTLALCGLLLPTLHLPWSLRVYDNVSQMRPSATCAARSVVCVVDSSPSPRPTLVRVPETRGPRDQIPDARPIQTTKHTAARGDHSNS